MMNRIVNIISWILSGTLVLGGYYVFFTPPIKEFLLVSLFAFFMTYTIDWTVRAIKKYKEDMDIINRSEETPDE